MRKILLTASALLMTAWLGGCTTSGHSHTDVTADDLVNVDDLVFEDADESGAIKTGEPAVLLGEVRKSAKEATAHVRSVLDRVKQITKGSDPVRTGHTALDQPFGVWEEVQAGVTLRLVVVRTADNRLRYFLAGKKAVLWKPLLTGVFIKKAKGVGGGRFHLSLTNVSELFGAPGKQGSIHFYFANHKAEAKGRRVVYRNVKDLGQKDGVAANYGMDFVHLLGVGGRIRAVGLGDLYPKLDGVEALALRVLWKAGQGGRADAIATHVWPLPVAKLYEAHECWDAKGKRSAYKDDYAGNDAENADEGDTKTCAGFAEEAVPQAAASDAGQDKDPQLEALLKDAGADAIPETDADESADPEA